MGLQSQSWEAGEGCAWGSMVSGPPGEVRASETCLSSRPCLKNKWVDGVWVMAPDLSLSPHTGAEQTGNAAEGKRSDQRL